MPSTTETGHHKNVAAFEDLISRCTAFGATYNPVKANLKLAAMNPQLAAAQAALQTVNASKTAYDNATNAREIAIEPLKRLTTKIINALTVTEAVRQTIDDARTIANKIHNKRAKEVEVPTEKELAEGAEPVKTISTAQQSFDSLVNHFGRLITILAAEPKYLPNENELKVATLNTQLTDLKTKNTTVVITWTALSNARYNRDKVLYDEKTGMVTVGQEVKIYVKSVFGAQSHQYKQLTTLQFKRPQGD